MKHTKLEFSLVIVLAVVAYFVFILFFPHASTSEPQDESSNLSSTGPEESTQLLPVVRSSEKRELGKVDRTLDRLIGTRIGRAAPNPTNLTRWSTGPRSNSAATSAKVGSFVWGSSAHDTGSNIERPRAKVALDKKISPVLKQEVDLLLENPRFDYPIPLIVQVQSDFFERHRGISRAGGHRSENMLSGVHAYTANLTAAQLTHLLRSPLVKYVTLDAVLRPSSDDGDDDDDDDDNDGYDNDGDDDDDDEESGGESNDLAGSSNQTDHDDHVLASVGIESLVAEGVLASTSAEGAIAVFDSGIAAHADIDPTDNRVVASADFTFGSQSSSDALYDDGYGHGTHVAGIIGGDDDFDDDNDGVNPHAKFVSVKVIGDDGTGSTSQLIQAIDWVIQNKDVYDIRIANLSVGHPPLESAS